VDGGAADAAPVGAALEPVVEHAPTIKAVVTMTASHENSRFIADLLLRTADRG
jgi:hypothetical protein